MSIPQLYGVFFLTLTTLEKEALFVKRFFLENLSDLNVRNYSKLFT